MSSFPLIDGCRKVLDQPRHVLARKSLFLAMVLLVQQHVHHVPDHDRTGRLHIVLFGEIANGRHVPDDGPLVGAARLFDNRHGRVARVTGLLHQASAQFLQPTDGHEKDNGLFLVVPNEIGRRALAAVARAHDHLVGDAAVRDGNVGEQGSRKGGRDALLDSIAETKGCVCE